jgi:hypothetical protein
MNSAFGTHTLLQQRTLDGISDSLDWLGVFHHTARERLRRIAQSAASVTYMGVSIAGEPVILLHTGTGRVDIRRTRVQRRGDLCKKLTGRNKILG